MKYYHLYKNKDDQKRFINFILILPLFIVIPLFLLLYFQYDSVAQLLSAKNDIIYEYLWVLPLTALAMGYFEIFYAMTRIHMKSIAGNILKEVILRMIISIFLIAVGYNYLSPENFIYALIFIYFSVTILMAVIAFKYEKPNFSLGIKIEKTL